MPTVITPKITDAGMTAAINANANGLQIAITHVSLGTGKYTPLESQVALAAITETVTVAGGDVTALGVIRLNVLFAEWLSAQYDVSEIGFYSGNPAAGGILFAVHSHPTNVITARTNLEYVASFGLTLSRVPTGSVVVTVDESASYALLLIHNHETAPDPHPQYIKASQKGAANGVATLGGDGLVPLNQLPPAIATDAELAASLAAHVSAVDPHPQYINAAELAAAFAGRRARSFFIGQL